MAARKGVHQKHSTEECTGQNAKAQIQVSRLDVDLYVCIRVELLILFM